MPSAKPYFFEEGQEYIFEITGEVKLPPDNEIYLVLFSPFSTKHLLLKKPYLNYGLKSGQSVKCRIDKINCSGKIFLEPEHPFYKEGNIYEFPLISSESIVNSEGKTETIMLVEDFLHQKNYVNTGKYDFQNISSVKCRVNRIKKAKLYLSLAENENIFSDFEIGKEFDFIIEGITALAEDEEYYILKDESDHIHYLRKKYFEDYGFSIGKIVRCRVLAKPSIFRHYLEPVHPHYKIGEVYDFFYSGTETYINETGTETKKIIVNDGTEKEYFVSRDDFSKLKAEPGSMISCLIKGIRMGRLVLECVS